MAKSEPNRHNASLGGAGERLAVAYLQERRFKIVEQNYRCRGGEIDIVARDGKIYVFIEVKCRLSACYGPPQSAVTLFKQRQISKAALTWLAANHKHDVDARFDVVAISFRSSGEPVIEHIVNAFDLAY